MGDTSGPEPRQSPKLLRRRVGLPRPRFALDRVEPSRADATAQRHRYYSQLLLLCLAAALLVAAQVALGITTLRLGLTVPAVTIGHQAVAALLVAVLGASLGRSLGLPYRPPTPELSHG
jgi:hypothetical protein